MLVYLDTCAVQRPTDDRNQLRVRVEADAVLAVLAAVRVGAVQLLSSDVLRFEVDNRPFAEGRLWHSPSCGSPHVPFRRTPPL